MSAPDDRQVTVFELADAFVFKHYVVDEDCYAALATHYDREEYRFEVPRPAFDAVREVLETHGFEVELVTDSKPYCVVVERYEPHAALLRASVAHWTRRGHEFFLMPSALAVERAIAEGATPVAETDLAVGI